MNRARGAGSLKIKNKKISPDSINTDVNPNGVGCVWISLILLKLKNYY